MKASAALTMAAAAVLLSGCASNDDRLDALEKRVAQLEQTAKEEQAAKEAQALKTEQEAKERKELQKQVNKQIAQARAKMREEFKIYSKEDLTKVEELYSVIGKKWDSQESKDSFQKLMADYPKTNRTGCAILYMGQMSSGDEQINYLQKAIDGYSDCVYGDGVIVGAFARYQLAWAYWKKGDKEKAQKLVDEIKAKYPDALTHGGKLLAPLLDTSKW